MPFLAGSHDPTLLPFIVALTHQTGERAAAWSFLLSGEVADTGIAR